MPFFRYEREQEDARKRHGGDKGGEHAEHEDEREALYDRGPEPEEDDARNEHRKMHVANGGPCAAKADMHGLARILPSLARQAAQLFFGAFKDKHIRIHRQTDRNDKPCDAGGRERDRDDFDDREHKGKILGERDGGDEAGEPIPRDHEERNDDEANTAGDHARFDGGRSQGRPYRGTVLELNGHRERAKVQIAYQVARLGRREIARDSRLPARNCFLNDRDRDWLTVEEDGERLSDIFAGYLLEKLSAFSIEIKKSLRRREARGRAAAEL